MAETLRTEAESLAGPTIVYLFWSRDQEAMAAQFWSDEWRVYSLTDYGVTWY